MASFEKGDKDFEAATEYVRSNTSSFVSEMLLKLYARYKQAKEGQCNTPKPGFFDFQGKQKWEAWKKLGDMDQDCAKKEYVDLVSQHDDNWRSKVSAASDKPSIPSRQLSLGVAVSTMVNPEADLDDDKKTIFDWCKEGNTQRVVKLLSQNNINIDEKDPEGMALLHWACDRGDAEMVNSLLKHGANINLQDRDGQTGLHYAMSCEHSKVVQVLLKHGASTSIADTDGQTVQDVVESSSKEIQEIMSSFPKR